MVGLSADEPGQTAVGAGCGGAGPSSILQGNGVCGSSPTQDGCYKKLAVPSETCGMPASSRGHQGLLFWGSWAREHLLPHSLLLL